MKKIDIFSRFMELDENCRYFNAVNVSIPADSICTYMRVNKAHMDVST
jgi:hypothetical protein